MKILDHFSESESKTKNNEDVIGFSEIDENTSAVWVIDGGSSVADKNYIDSENGDINWFANSISRKLRAYSQIHKNYVDVLQNTIDDVKSEYVNCVGSLQNVPKYAWPIAAMTWVKFTKMNNGSQLVEQIDLGDCSSIFRSDNSVWQIRPPAENLVENAIRSKIASMPKKKSGNDDEKRNTLIDGLRARREEQHSFETPTIIGFNSKNINKIPYRRKIIHTDKIEFLLCSDGFFRLVDLFKKYSAHELIEKVSKIGSEKLVRELRNIEMDDKDCHTYPRLKISDDVAVIFGVMN
ncbi:hypothetical protein [Nisaea sediminum]|uniref:hypothetical protein n=1 Tax=Nisaea sediminum TaxID=2775867 RepID=UPI00186783A3|nr:hypothetical protein [Nisaea sediminum]